MESIRNVRAMMVPQPHENSRNNAAWCRMRDRLDLLELQGTRRVPTGWLRTLRAAGLLAPIYAGEIAREFGLN